MTIKLIADECNVASLWLAYNGTIHGIYVDFYPNQIPAWAIDVGF